MSPSMTVVAPLHTGMSEDALSDLFLATDPVPLETSSSLSQESVSCLFKTWACEEGDSPSADCLGDVDMASPTCVRKVLEELDGDLGTPLELPPFKRRPLCIFMNYRGTRRADSLGSIPSLAEDIDSYQHPTVSSWKELSMPKIDETLKNDPKMQDFVLEFNRLMKKAQEAEKEMNDYVADASSNNKKTPPKSPPKKKRKPSPKTTTATATSPKPIKVKSMPLKVETAATTT